MMHNFHQQQPNQPICAPPKSYYMDRLGNMSSTISSSSSGVMSSGGSSSSSSGGGSGGMAPPRKQILSLKPKISPYAQDNKDSSTAGVPVTKLALKKDKKVDKNVITTLAYRKPSSVTSSGGSTSSASTTSSSSSSSSSTDYHRMMMMSMMMNGAAFHSDTIMDDSVFSSLLNSAYAYNNNNQHDMLHSHPIWSPQVSNQMMMMSPDAVNYFIEKENQFLVQ